MIRAPQQAPTGPEAAPAPSNEDRRLAALQESRILDTASERAYDDLTALASAICGTPMALIGLVDGERQWFKSRVGLEVPEMPRSLAFCAHAILEPGGVMEVPDTACDPRFAGHPLVTGAPGIRFYAGAPILSHEGLPLGTLCVIDVKPRRLDASQQSAIEALARTAGELLNARRQESLLRQTGERLRAVFEHTHAGMSISDPAGRRILVNDRYCQILGRTREELLRALPQDLNHPDDYARSTEQRARLIETGEPYTIEKRYLRGDGGTVWVRIQVSGVVDEQGRVVAVVASVEDISESRRMAERLRHSEETLLRTTRESASELERQVRERTAEIDALIECMPSGVVAVDMQGRPRINNPAAVAISGIRSEDFPADPGDWGPVYGVCTPEGRALELEEIPLARALRGQAVNHQELLIRNRRDGTSCFVVASARPLIDARGEQIGAVVVFSDINERKQAEQALARSDARFRLITDVTPQILWTAAPDGGIEFVNGPGLAFFGRPLADLAGRGWLNFLHPDDVAPTVDVWTRALASGSPVETQYRVRRHDGEYRWHIARGVAQLGSDGRPQCWYGVSTDIEDLKRAQQAAEAATLALTESEQRFRLLSEINPHFIWSARPDGGMDYVNTTATEYFGNTAAEMYEQGWRAYAHPDDLPRALKEWKDSLATGAPLQSELRVRRRDGVYRWFLARAKAIRDERGAIVRWLGSNFDIDDIKRAQQAAEAATASKSQFLANMSHEIRTPMNGVIGMTTLLADTALDAEQREYVETIRNSGEHLLTVINDILDFSKAEAGKLTLERYAFALRSCVEEALELVAANADAKGLELVLDVDAGVPQQVSGDAGRLRQVLVNLLSNAIKFTPSGEVLVQVAVQAQDEAGWRLHFVVSDTGIGIAPEKMDRLFGVFSQVDPSHTRTYGGTGLGLAISKHLVESMNGRIQAQSTPGRGSTFSFEIEVGRAAEAAAVPSTRFEGRRVLLVDDNRTNRRVLRLLLESRGLIVDEAADPGTGLRMAGEQTYSAALLDFNMPGMTGVQLAQALRRLPRAQNLPLLLLGSISGGAAEHEDPLFFARMLKPVRHSTLIEQLALLFGELPVQRRPADHDDHKPGLTNPLRILVAEDNSVNQRVALYFLGRLGYRADLVGNGLEAVEAVQRQTYDVVLMDVQMPEMDGYEATREIRRRLQPGPRIVAVTAGALEGDEQRCRDAGMDDYLAKPLDPAALAAALQRAGRTGEDGWIATTRRATQGNADVDADYRDDMLAGLVETYEAEGARELVLTIEADLPNQLAELERALREGEAQVAARALHSIKSVVGLVGAQGLVRDLQAAERACIDGPVAQAQADAPGLVDRCRGLFARLRKALDG